MINELRRRAADDYLYMRAWGHLMGTCDRDVDLRVEHARRSGAPADTIYRNQAGQWVTVGELGSAETRKILRGYAQRAGGVALPAPVPRTPRCEALVWRAGFGLDTCDWPLTAAGECEWAGGHVSDAMTGRKSNSRPERFPGRPES